MFSLGQQIGHYKILSAIGAGGMGQVFLAEDTKLDRKVAIKFLNEEFSRDSDKLNRFVQEAKAVSALNHPNILTVHEIGEIDNTNYIVTEFIEGKTLREHLSSDEAISLSAILKISVQVAEALSAAHQAGIIHRDIKPENIMIREDGYAKVLDFGLAKLTEKKKSDRISLEGETKAFVQTNPGMVMGTVSYMSPEQTRAKETDARTDLWSLGVVLYEMLSGKVPFTGETINHTIVSILEKEPLLLENVPDELQRIVRKALTKDKEMRYQTARDLLIDLKNLRRTLDIQGEIERSVIPNPEAKTESLNENATQIYSEKSIEETKSEDAKATQNITSSSSLEYAVTQAKSHKIVTAAVAMILLSIVSVIAYFSFFAKSATKQIESIAVLPFENASGNADLDYLSDGVSESVIDRLSQIPQLKVIARSSSFRYRGQNLDLKQIAEALGVDAIVTGSVVQRGDGYLLRVDVTDVRENKQLWGKNFNRKASDVQILQSDISSEIAENLRLRLSGTQSQQLAKEGTTSPQAYEALEKGRFFLTRVGQNNTNKAVEQFERAIALDPNYALAYSYLSEAYGFGGGSNLPREQRKAKRLAAALKAVELAPNLAEAHFALARIKFNVWDWAEAEREYKLAIELSPNFYRAHSGYSTYLTVMGRHDEAIAEAKRSVELNPLDFLAAMTVSNAFRNARRNDESIEAAKRALELEPNFYFTHAVLGDAYEAKGMYKEALAQYQEALKRREGGGGLRIEALIGVIYAKMGERAKAEEILEDLKAKGDASNEIVLLYDALGKRDEAFAVLEQAFAERRGDLGFMRVNPKFDNLRSDPRFKNLLRRMNLPE